MSSRSKRRGAAMASALYPKRVLACHPGVSAARSRSAAAELAQLARDLGLDVERLAPPAGAALVARDDERADLGLEGRGLPGPPVERAQLHLDVDRIEAAAPAALVARLEQLADLLVALVRCGGARPCRLARRPV